MGEGRTQHTLLKSSRRYEQGLVVHSVMKREDIVTFATFIMNLSKVGGIIVESTRLLREEGKLMID